jgi:hypothetical protein
MKHELYECQLETRLAKNIYNSSFRQLYAYPGSNAPGLDESGHIMKKGDGEYAKEICHK